MPEFWLKQDLKGIKMITNKGRKMGWKTRKEPMAFFAVFAFLFLMIIMVDFGFGKKAFAQTAVTDNDISKSQNYKIGNVRFGGGVILADGRLRDLPVEISSIKSEVMISGEDGSPRFMISWKTNKEAISEVSYSRSDGETPKVVKEDGYGFVHSVLLSDVELSTIYVYNIKVRDKWGNEVSSEYFSAYTGDKSESIFDLIVAAIENTFGWAMKK